MDDTGDGSNLIALLQSDHLIQAIQRELKSVYPGKEIPTNTIRRVLYSALLRQNLRGAKTSKGWESYHKPEVQLLVEREESLYDQLWYDKVYSVWGG